ncbi:MAG TPA: type II toxin-antitoxin system VapC family toxin [Kiritimatiellia bacterium]|nr:type II toxin-antitoxin system VapC family toxin [Kiritimatiellia bacterium]
MSLLLDTHAVLWTLCDDPRLGKNARKILKASTEKDLFISDMSLLEIALLADRGRITLSGTLQALLGEIASACRVLPINPAIAAKAISLKLNQSDPFDRVIAATAWHHDLILVTRDARLTECREIKTRW